MTNPVHLVRIHWLLAFCLCGMTPGCGAGDEMLQVVAHGAGAQFNLQITNISDRSITFLTECCHDLPHLTQYWDSEEWVSSSCGRPSFCCNAFVENTLAPSERRGVLASVGGDCADAWFRAGVVYTGGHGEQAAWSQPVYGPLMVP